MSPKSKITTDLLATAAMFTITVHRWGNRRKADLDRVTTEADHSQLRLTKQLIESPEYKEVRRCMAEAKAWCLERCMPSFIKSGVFVVRLDMVQAFEAHLAAQNKRLAAELIPAFKRAYPAQVQQAEQRLKDQFDIRDYPDASLFDTAFGVEWGWVTFGVPENVPADVRARELKKLQEKMLDAEKEIRAALRESFNDLLAAAVERLKVAPGEKPKVFRDSLLENFTQFFDTFKAKNLMDDRELEAVVEKARTVIAKVTPDALRERSTVRQKTVAAFEQVKAEVDKLVASAPSRRFRLDEED